MSYNEAVEAFRESEYPMLQGKVYLDHAGSTIPAKSLMEKFASKMVYNLYGNPHSKSDPAQLSGREVDDVREKTLRFLGADPEHFDLVFTANATAAIKLVADSFRDLAAPGTFWYGYHKDAHTSLVGVRELTAGTHHCFSNDREIEEWLKKTCRDPPDPSDLSCEIGLPGLFAYPGQSNMTGRRLPLSWTSKLRESDHQNTFSLLDAAGLTTTTQLDFSDPDAAPDFTALSFYKIFGFPDLGALIVRRKSGAILYWRKYFGGGTVSMLTVLRDSSFQRKTDTIHDGLEDGTLPFHNIIALGCAIDVHNKLYGSMNQISIHTAGLAKQLYEGMAELAHSNGQPLCVIYTDGPETCSYGDSKTQGATIAFSVSRSDGSYVGHSAVEKTANDKGIYLRSGGLCNPGGIASHIKVGPWQFKRAWSAGHRCGGENSFEIIGGKPTGVVRASLGAMSTFSDIQSFLSFLAETFIEDEKIEGITRSISGRFPIAESKRSQDSGFMSSVDEKSGPQTLTAPSIVTSASSNHGNGAVYGSYQTLPIHQGSDIDSMMKRTLRLSPEKRVDPEQKEHRKSPKVLTKESSTKKKSLIRFRRSS